MRSTDKKLIAMLCSLIVLLVVVICLAVSVYKPDVEKQVEYIPGTAVQSTNATQDQPIIDNNVTPNQSADTTTAATTQPNMSGQIGQNNTPGVSTTVSVSAMSDQQLLDTLCAAINKTKAYTGNVSVNHVESFEANVTECTGGAIVKSVANTIVGMVINPVDEVLSFSGGKATNSEDEVLPILLPQKGNFSLSMSGVKSISGSVNGTDTVIKVQLVQEQVDLYTVPTANASAIGYLDINSYDTSVLEITSANINYVGSTLEVHIRPDGYVSYAKYAMPMNVEGSAKGGSISGSAVFDGQQTEIWQFNW